jgi:hypothetical protein
MPHAFQVLARSLQALCPYIISGWGSWYVDDLMTVATYVIDSAQVESTVQRLLGEGSVAQKKSECVCRLRRKDELMQNHSK